jgi:hypothetical protein
VTDLSLVFEKSGVFFVHFNCALWSGGVTSHKAIKEEATEKPAAAKETIPLLRFVSQAGLAIKNPPKKPTQKPTQKNPLKMFFWGFFKFLIFYENNTNFSL